MFSDHGKTTVHVGKSAVLYSATDSWKRHKSAGRW